MSAERDDDSTDTVAGKGPRVTKPRPAQNVPKVLLGRYEIIGELGHGGMGFVFRARDKQLGRDVAIKLVRPRKDLSAMMTARLLREAQALAQLSHPNVVAVYDVLESEGDVCVVMELVTGKAADEWMREQLRPWREVLRVFRDAGRGLAAAHAVGLVHRDFKPANLIIGDDGRVRVLDFGLARPMSSSASGSFPSLPIADNELTQDGAIVGTPPYMSPEQHRGGASDARSDQFSYCVSFYRALYGQRPFGGDTYGEVKQNILAGNMRPPPAGSEVPVWLRDVVLRGLAIEPHLRWPTMDALLDALGRDVEKRRSNTLLIVGASLAVAAAGGVAWYGYAHRDRGVSCASDSKELAGVWDAGRKRAVSDAFGKSSKPFAGAALTAVTRGLDGYTNRWTAMRIDACKATHERGTQSNDLLDLRMACLQRRLDDVRALVDVLASADNDVISRATELTNQLTPLDACADVEALRAPVPLPTDPKVRKRVEAAHRGLATVKTLWISGRYANAKTALAPVLSEAQQLGWRPLEGEALLAEARLADSTGDYAMAEQRFKDASAAAEAGRDDETAALARNGLVWVVGERLGRYDEARDIAVDAAAKVERLGGHELIRADLDQKMGVLAFEQGKFEEAEKRAKSVLDTRQKLLAPDDPTLATALSDLGDVAVQRANYDAAIDAYQRALTVAEKSVGPDHSMCGMLRGNLGNALSAKGRLSEALVQLERARDITERSLGPDHAQLGTIAINIGNTLVAQGHPAEAAPQFKRASAIWTKALGPDHPNVATALFRGGEVALAQGHAAEATAAFQRALEIWQAKLGAEHPSLAAAYMGLGDAAFADKHYDDALVDYARALALLDKTFGEGHVETVDLVVSIGRTQIAMKESRAGKATLDRALKIVEAANDPLESARIRFLVAKALAPVDSARARQLAQAASEVFAKAGADHTRDADEVAVWLRELKPRGAR
jgi:eukaryotic-like serine/threonine-protein kinase